MNNIYISLYIFLIYYIIQLCFNTKYIYCDKKLYVSKNILPSVQKKEFVSPVPRKLEWLVHNILEVVHFLEDVNNYIVDFKKDILTKLEHIVQDDTELYESYEFNENILNQIYLNNEKKLKRYSEYIEKLKDTKLQMFKDTVNNFQRENIYYLNFVYKNLLAKIDLITDLNKKKLDKEKKKNVIELKEYLEDLKKRMFDMHKRLNDIIITKSSFLKSESELNMQMFETSAIDYVNNNSNFEVFSTYIINDFMLNKKKINVLNYDSNLFFKNNFMYFNFLHNYLKEKKDENVLNVYIYLKDPLIQEYELNYFNYYVVLDLYILDVIIKNVDLLIEKKGKKRKNVNHILVCIDNYVVKYNVLSSNIYLDIQQDIKSFFHESNRNVDGSKIQDMLFHFEKKNNSIYQNNMFHDKYYKKKIKKDIKEEKKQNDTLQKYNKNIDPLLFIRKKNIFFDSQKEYYKKFLSSYTYEEIINILCNKSTRCNNRIFQLINDVNKNTFILKSHLALKNELKKFFQINQNKLLKNKTGIGAINNTQDDINRISNMNLASNTTNTISNITSDANANNNTNNNNNNNTNNINNNNITNANNINNNNNNNNNNNTNNMDNNNNINNINNNNINNNNTNNTNNLNNNNNNNIFNNEDASNKCSAYTHPFSNDIEKNYSQNKNDSFSHSDQCFKLLNSTQGSNKSSDFINMQNIDDYLNTYYVAYHESFKVVKKEHYYSIVSHIFESYLNIVESINDNDHRIHKKYPNLKGRNVSINFLGQLPEIMKVYKTFRYCDSLNVLAKSYIPKSPASVQSLDKGGDYNNFDEVNNNDIENEEDNNDIDNDNDEKEESGEDTQVDEKEESGEDKQVDEKEESGEDKQVDTKEESGEDTQMVAKEESGDDNKDENNKPTDEEHDEITEQIGFLKNHNQKYMRLFQKHLLEEIKFINFFEFLVQKRLGVILEKNEFLKLYIFYGQKNLPSMPYTPLFFTCRTIIKIEVLRDVNTNQIIYSSRSFFLETLITLKEYKIKNESAYIVIETTDESSTIKKRLKMDMLHKISPMSHINAYVVSNKGREIVYHKGNIYQRSASDIKNVISDIRNDFLNIILPQYHLFDLFDNYVYIIICLKNENC
ncbi:conserved Plasmodium protein, unknown function [Plasmodium sp. gorilla clade G2]|uniref:conserved Plasmodium protein, unknown function n=1 Tax=Plasmodium sp. gorilla clade G2 TaxID=880535 RepID=UPI000D20A06F|nr:conserved Plasmodium protein, unknown function [Plasmodium sp. gorilla clade G2]SOV10971.1 conserved Plasmodium protein, unknown function [Plasmodium sp. gorilla clade G2]